MKGFRIIGPLVLLVLLLGALPGPALAQNPGCGTTVMTNVTLTSDMTCALAGLDATHTAAIKIGMDGLTIDLAGHRLICRNGDNINCMGQPISGTTDTAIGIDFDGKTNVVVKSSTPGGEIWGFDRGVVIAGVAKGTVQDLLISSGSDLNIRVDTAATTTGILVAGGSCPGAIILDGNTIQFHRYGIKVENSSCVKIQRNEIRWNRAANMDSHGIQLIDSPNNTITNNWVDENGFYGSTSVMDGGITLSGSLTTSNRIAQNTVMRNCGDGISTSTGAQSNPVGGNSLTQNGVADTKCNLSCPDFVCSVVPVVVADLAERNAVTLNSWRKNNQCDTQNQNVPAGICTSTVTTTVP